MEFCTQIFFIIIDKLRAAFGGKTKGSKSTETFFVFSLFFSMEREMTYVLTSYTLRRNSVTVLYLTSFYLVSQPLKCHDKNIEIRSEYICSNSVCYSWTTAFLISGLT